jgi:hypothetical protein
MTRRDALLRLTALFGGTIVGASRFLSRTAGAADAPASSLLSIDDLALLNEVGETILPTTADSAGAKAADVAAFMQEIVRDFYDDRERATFREGLVTLRAANFDSLPPEARHALLVSYDQTRPQPEFYRMMKQLAVWGYFSSEIGAKQALNYLPVPGAFQGCITIEPGAKAWAN